MGEGVAAATYAVVIDTYADIVPTPNRGNAVRLLMSQADAQALWWKLGELFS